MQVFFRAYKTREMDGKTSDLLCPLDGFTVEIENEDIKVWVEGSMEVYWMSEAQYNHLLLALKDSSPRVNDIFIDGSE